jgi:hypothetical protein
MRIVGGLLVLIASMFVPSAAHADDSRTTSADKPPSPLTAGLLLFGSSYGLSVGLASGAYREERGGVAKDLLFPVVGSWLLLGEGRFDTETTITSRLADAMDCDNYCLGGLLLVPVALFEFGFLLVDPLAQASGLVMAMIGAGREKPSFAPKKKEEAEEEARATPKVNVKPTFVGTGPGVALSITEW